MTTDAERIAITGIAATAVESFLEAMIGDMVTGANPVAFVRSAVENSVYWPEFREIVARGDVQEDDVADNPVLAQCVLGWARA